VTLRYKAVIKARQSGRKLASSKLLTHFHMSAWGQYLMTNIRKWWSLAAIGLIATTGFYTWASDGRMPEAGQQARQTGRVGLGMLTETVIATGVIRPMVGAEVNVGSRISGTVVSLPVEVGDRVEVDQLLAELDSTALEAATDQVRADVALARPRVALAESILKRRQRLAGQGLASDEDLDTALRDLAVERAQLAASKARLRSAEIVLGYTRITAPIQGVVAEVSTREGETVAADFSAPTFVTILDLDRLEVLAYVDETDIGRVAIDQIATFTVDTYPDVEFQAVVNAIQPRAELQGSVVNYVVRLDFEPAENFILRPEMTAHVRLVVSEREDALTAPRNALKRRDGRQYMVVERDGEWVETNVRTGWRSDNSVEILSGVREGDVVELNPTRSIN
jgi:RND family efflux transporter MFP subunit